MHIICNNWEQAVKLSVVHTRCLQWFDTVGWVS